MCRLLALIVVLAGCEMPHRVYILAGQSNAVGRALSAGLSDSSYADDYPAVRLAVMQDCPNDDGAANACDVESNGWIDLQTSIDPDELAYFGPEVAIGRYLDTADENQVYIIKCADSGTSLINDWAPDPSTGTFMWSRSTRFIKRNLDLIPGDYEIAAFIWIQGEADATAAVNGDTTYESNLRVLVSDVRARYGSDLPFIISRLSELQKQGNGGQLQDARVQNIMDAQDAVAADTAYVSVVNTDSFDFQAGNLHYSADGTIEVGLALAAAAANTQKDGLLLANTSIEAIRANHSTTLQALTPTQHSRVAFQEYRRRGNFEEWAESKPAASFRRFTIRDLAEYEEPDVSDTFREYVSTQLQLVVAYPMDGRYEGGQARDVYDVIREDMHQINFAIGLNGYGNYVAGHEISEADSKTIDEGESVLFLTIDFVTRFWRAVT